MAMKSAASKIPLVEAGVVPARLVRIVEIGEHQHGDYGVKDQVYFYYTLPTRLIEEEGEYQGKQQLIRSKPLRNSDSEKAALYDHRVGLGTTDTTDYNEYLDKPCFVTIVHNEVDSNGTKNTYANIQAISGVPEGFTVPESDTVPFYFDFDNPDPDVWAKLGEYTQNKIKDALNYEGSEVQKMVAHLEAMEA